MSITLERSSLKPSRQMPRWRRATYAAAALGAAGIGWALLRSAPATPTPPVPIVTVASPLQRKVAQWDQYIGRFEASQKVDVRPRVSGAVVAIHFKDGQTVVAGQPLFTIDPRPYAAALAEAKAGVATAASALSLAQSDYDRAARLQGDDAVSASELDGLKSRLKAARAALIAAQAREAAKALDMDFTEVRAPIAGRISDRRVDIGNLVSVAEGGNATLLTTINTLDPIYFSFDASEALYLKARREHAADGAPVEIRLQDESSYRWKGKLDFTDNGVDARSDTIRGRATIANPQLLLTPGMFGDMRMANGVGPALLVPDTAVQTDQADKAVLVVGADNVIALRTVKLGPVVDGLRIISAGLKPTDRVVIGGAVSIAPGVKVETAPGRIVGRSETTAALAPTAASASFTAN